MKRTLDILVAGTTLLLLAPLLLFIGAWVRLDSEGPALFRQTRVGRFGRKFEILKFRTMYTNQAVGAIPITAGPDPRITPAGRMLRKSKLDELPQLVNVLWGDMTLVGPRPEVPKYVDLYPSEVRERVLSVKPGITDFASIEYRNESELLGNQADPERFYVEHILPKKLDLCMQYVATRSFSTDLRILAVTVAAVFFPRKIDALKLGLVAFLHDLTVVGVAWLAAYWIRFNLVWPIPYLHDGLKTLPLAITVHGTVFLAFRLYRGVWRYASLTDLRHIAMSVAVGTVLLTTAAFLARIEPLIPRVVLILHPFLLFVLMGSARIGYRMWREGQLVLPKQLNAEPVLIVGAGWAGARLAQELEISRAFRTVGFIDDDRAKAGRSIRGVRVLGPIDALTEIAHRYSVEQVIIAIPSTTHETLRRIAQICNRNGIKMLTVPTLEDLVSGKASISRIRNVELDDLIGRAPIILDNSKVLRALNGQVTMITGAGGSIGSELCRQIARFNPAFLVLVDVSEFALYRIEQEFRESFPDIPIAPIVADVRNDGRMAEVLSKYNPLIVFHAAAYKHVPLMEQENAWEAVSNNAWGTYVLASAAIACGVKHFVLISTDKAVNPTNVMGASKRLAEMICNALQKGSETCFTVVRFGNVLGSTGSVIPKFQQQISKGGPITITHPDVTRYFMSISEAAQLVLQASVIAKGEEIFVLEMGDPVRIVDLAKELIRLSGIPDENIEIRYTGLRPGEKMHEELLTAEEHVLPMRHEKLRVARARDVSKELIFEFSAWMQRPPASSVAIKARLQGWIPEYVPGVTGYAGEIDLSNASPSIVRQA